MLSEERPHLGRLPGRAALDPYLREDRKVARDCFVSWEGSRYGVHWKWADSVAQVGQRQGTVEIWAAMSASRCIPGPRGRVSASSCPASGRDCLGETASPIRRR